MISSRLLQSYFHPSLRQLSKFQLAGKVRRITNSFRSRRKIVLSVLAILLGCVWLGQTILAILFRESADPDSLRTWLSVSLLLYCVFHFIKIGSRKPVEPFEWTAAEQQNLLSAPLTRKHLVTYRLTNYMIATSAKALCFSVVMIPDLPSLSVAFAGMFLGLSMIDLVRVLLERVAWTAASTGKRCWAIVRTCMLLPALSLLGVAFYQTTCSPDFESTLQSSNPLALPQLFLAVVSQVVAQPPISWIMVPWVAVVDTILAPQYDTAFVMRLGMLYATMTCLTVAVYFADAKGTIWIKQLALRKKGTGANSNRNARQEKRKKAKPPVGFGGAKAIVWHQVLGAVHYRSTLIFALAIPTLLSCMPLLSKSTSFANSLSVIGSMVFYSFLLLPPALMLDFRRDAQRLSMWKATPVDPFALTVGQLAVPVALMSMFQAAVLLIAVLIGGHSTMIMLAWPVLIPMNVLIIGMENAIFLMHPYRRNQEGIEVFLRTILTFTGKGLLFALGLVLTLVWAWAAIGVGKMFESQAIGSILFGIGVAVALSAMAWLATKTCAKFFERLDVSQDLPPA